jgi:hypothetical protein
MTKTYTHLFVVNLEVGHAHTYAVHFSVGALDIEGTEKVRERAWNNAILGGHATIVCNYSFCRCFM